MARKRRAKSSISRLPPEQKAHVERLLREGRLTLREMIDELEATYPGEPAAEVSRSALHRYSQQFEEMTRRMREIQQVSEVMVGELGEGIGAKAGELLTQAVVTLATDVALRQHGNEEVSVDTVRKLAMAAKHAIDSQRVDMNVRKAIRDEARQQLLAEQKEALDTVVKSGGLSDEAAKAMRDKILGVA